MSTCKDCGTKLRSGICTNCHEELYINDYQMPEHPFPVSDEWNKTVATQRKERLHDLLAGFEIRSAWIESKQEAEVYFKSKTDIGFEGIVLKNLDSPLTYGPCDWVKMKYKDQSDYIVLNIDQNKEIIEVMVPKLTVPFTNINVGVKAPNRYKKYIKIGDMVTIEHQGVLASGSLRHPVLIKKKEWK